MKQKDYMLLIVIGVVSASVSIFLSNFFINSDANRSQEVEVVEELSADFQRPPSDYFNEDSINPTRIIEIGPQDTSPFGSQ